MSSELIKELIIYAVSGALGTLGFVLMCNIKVKKLPFAVLGSLLVIMIWFFVSMLTTNVFIPNLIATMFGTLYSEIMARVTKAPTTIYLIPSIITLVPGSRLYYTMSDLVHYDFAAMSTDGRDTFFVALGIAVGIVIITTIFGYFTTIKKRKQALKR